MFGYILGRAIVATNLFPILKKQMGLHIANSNISSYFLTLILSMLLLLSIRINQKITYKK
jgi:hypothetical protein